MNRYMDMMNRHTTISTYLTGSARRALLLFTLLVVAGSAAWGQVTLISSGVIDRYHEGEYSAIKANFPKDASSFIPDFDSWGGITQTYLNNGQHWDGTSTSNYFDKWNSSRLERGTHYKDYTLNLPKGSYTLMAAARGKEGTTVYMKVNDYEVSLDGVGDFGKGITTSGDVSFSDGTFANDGQGRGWQYIYIQFTIEADNTPVTINLSGESSSEGWLGFTRPKLLVSWLKPGSIKNNAPHYVMTEAIPEDTYTVKGQDSYDHGGQNCKYLRFYLVDNATGTGVAIPGFSSTKNTYFHNLGMQGMATAGSGFLQDNNFTITFPEKTSYTLYCYLSNSDASIINHNGIDYDVEPEIDVIFEFNITKQPKYTFPGSLLSHTTPQTIEVPVDVSSRYSKTLTELSDKYNAIVTGLSAEGTMLTTDMLKEANGYGATATQGNTATNCTYVLNNSTGQPYGDAGVISYADLSAYAKLVVTVTEGTPRFLFNRDVADGQWNEDESQSHLIDNTRGGWSAKYFTQEGNVYTVNLQKMKADKGYVHLHAIKSTGGNVTVESMVLYGTPLTTADMHLYNSWTDASQGISSTDTYYYVLGRSTDLPFGDGGVNAYVDLSAYKKLVVTMSAGTPRFMFNRDIAEGQWNEDENQSHLIEYPKDGWVNRYFTKEGNTYIVDLEKMVQDKGYAHLHAIKGANWQNVTMENIALYDSPTGKVYARLFVADKDTGEQIDQNALTITPPAGWTNTDYGYVYFDDVSGLKDALTGIVVSSSNPLYAGNATLSLVFSADMSRLSPANAASVSAIVAEPDWEKQYLLDFYKVDEFVGTLINGGKEIREAVELANASVTSCQLEKLAAAYSQVTGGLSNSSGKVYARLFASDDAGNTLDDQNLLNFGNLTSKGWTWRDGYGWIYYGDGFSESLLQGITVSSANPLPSTGAQVGLVVSSGAMPRLTPASPGSAADITKEPNWEVLYLDHFTYPFAGEVKDPFFSHSREVLLTSTDISAGRVQIPLNEALERIESEYVRSNVSDETNTGLGSNLHIRWFVTYDGEMIANSENYLTPLVNNLGHQEKTSYGIYWNSAAGGVYPLTVNSEGSSSETRNWLNMTFKKPDYGEWGKYKVVVWLSDDTSTANGQTQEGNVLTHEPDINMVYYYSFFEEENFKFVHSKGAAVEAYPDLPYLIMANTSLQQYDWDNSTSTIVRSTEGDTRQGVHTVIYDIYMNPSGGPKALKLPFERYFEETGNDLEPNAYIRWYDWNTDLGSDELTAVGTWLEEFKDYDTGNSRGLFALNRDLNNQKPTHSMVGVTYDPSGLSSDGDIIACDVSKYYDGIYRSSLADTRPGFEGLNKPYMLHEPTLSIRYLFRIHPSSEVAAAIAAGHNSWIAGVQGTNDALGLETGASLNAVKDQLFNNIFEDNGRVVVSLKGSEGQGTFALRAGLSSLDNYFVNVGNTQCDHITWRAYLEDATGLWRRSEPIRMGENSTSTTERTHNFTLSAISGHYILLSDATEEPEKDVTAAPGMRFHLLGFVGGSGEGEQAAIHYELEFLDAPALLVDELDDWGGDVLHRRKAYLDSRFNFGGRVSFDEFFNTITLENQNDNQTEKPLPWKEAQYSFCYPQIDQYRIRTPSSGLTPIHGDYILLKSAGVPGISDHMNNNLYYKYFFYRAAGWEAGATQDPMYDFTYEYGNGTYGGFLYVDASDEARTIASLEFEANLCSGSQLFFTAAISDITTGGNGSIAPQLMIHVYGVDENENRSEKPILSFHSGDLRSVASQFNSGSFKYCKWYQLYGHAAIPHGIDVSQYSKFAVDIDNYSPNTNGADYCVDEIRFYTSSGMVNVKMDGGTCADEEMKFSANIDMEHLESRITLSDQEKYLYYRIYEKTSEENGLIQYQLYPQNPDDYSLIYGNGTNSYGQVPIYKYKLTESGELDTNYETQNAGYEFIDGMLYFDLLNKQELKLEQGKSYFIALTKLLDDPGDLTNENNWSNPNEACDIYSNFFVPRMKFVHFLAIDDENEVASQIIEGVCGQPSEAHKEYIIQTNYPDDDSATGFKTLPYGYAPQTAEVKKPILADATLPEGSDHLEDDPDGENRDQNGVLFDFFVGSETELISKYVIGDVTYNSSLLQAVQAYRTFERVHPQWCHEYKTEIDAAYASWAPAEYAILQDAISKGKLLLRASYTFEYDLLETQTFMALPVKKNYVFDGVPYVLCNYIPFTFTVDGGFNIPDLTLGFDDVDYTAAGRERVIRVGLEQLNKMKHNGYLLHLPVNMFVDNHRQMSKKLYFPQNAYFTISAVDRDAASPVPNTTDPTKPAIGTKFAKIVPTVSGETRAFIDKKHMYIALNLSECEINFKEGYQYEVATNFFDEEDEADSGNPDAKACIGDLFLMIKVVPEFVTWDSQYLATEDGKDYYSANWYNDDNWQRSTRADLYKDLNGSDAKQNTPTEGHPGGYDNNGQGALTGLNASKNPGFVPMKFTNVILPSGNHAPSLINEPRVEGVGVGARRQGGGFLNYGPDIEHGQTLLLTDRSPRDPDGTPDNERTSSGPTENIFYDMLVRYSYTDGVQGHKDSYGEGCFGHRELRDVLFSSGVALTTEQAAAYNEALHPDILKVEGNVLTPEEAHAYNWKDVGEEDLEAKVFDCEKFQGNVCRDIYFKHDAELLRQQRLTYQRAWVEKELVANKWYLMSSPLQYTYAGDMYVPPTMTDPKTGTTVKGRQLTEAFQPISFNTEAVTANRDNKITSQPAYSRTKYPIYQRSWGDNNGRVYVQQNDIRTNSSYLANIGYSPVTYSTETTSIVEWGHTFNDVQVPYSTLKGFAIRAHKKDQKDGSANDVPALIRLPKADESYEYYNWGDASSDPAIVKTVLKPAFEYTQDDGTSAHNIETLFTVPSSYRLITDTHDHDGDLEFDISAMQQQSDYVLVGNPYMVSIDVNKFFATNNNLDQTGYWTVEAGLAEGHSIPEGTNIGFIKPMQGFFVKKGTATKITFNRNMQVDGNFPPQATSSGVRQMALTLSAANSHGGSSASMELNEKASDGYVGGEDVETLFDSNLADVPMVYTVAADGKAVSVNQMPKLTVVPFGVVCSGDEPVEVTIAENGEKITENGQLFVIDAVLGTSTPVSDGSPVSVQPNDYGRYFLTFDGNSENRVKDVVDGIVISVRNGVVTVTAQSNLSHVSAVNTGGAAMYEATDCGNRAQFQLRPGTYVIEAEGDAGKRMAKIIVK